MSAFLPSQGVPSPEPRSPGSALPSFPCQDLKKYGATTVVRVCEVTYDKAPLEKDGITVVVRLPRRAGLQGAGAPHREAGTRGLSACALLRPPRRVRVQASPLRVWAASGAHLCLPAWRSGPCHQAAGASGRVGWGHLAGPWGGSTEAVGRDPGGCFLGPRCWGPASRRQALWDGPWVSRCLDQSPGASPLGRTPSQATVVRVVEGSEPQGQTGLPESRLCPFPAE